MPSSVATKGSPTEAGKDKEASEGAEDVQTSQDATEGAYKPSDGGEYNTVTTADQPVKPSVARRASTWSPFSGVASKLQRRFSTRSKGVSMYRKKNWLPLIRFADFKCYSSSSLQNERRSTQAVRRRRRRGSDQGGS